MPTKKTLAALGASSLLVVLCAAPAFAEDIPKLEKENLEGTKSVDPGASKGKDPSIVKQEKENLEGTGPNVDPGASKGKDPSIVDQEKKDLQ
jgi:TusA-related sulfurtransferase